MGVCASKQKPPEGKSTAMTVASSDEIRISTRGQEAYDLYILFARYMDLVGDISFLPYDVQTNMRSLYAQRGAMMVLACQVQKKGELENASSNWLQSFEERLNRTAIMILQLYEDFEFSRSFPLLRESFKEFADDVDKFLSSSPYYCPHRSTHSH